METSQPNTDDDSSDSERLSLSSKWTKAINRIHLPVLKALLSLSSMAVYNPRRTVALVTLISIAILGIGLGTNFTLDVDEDVLWTPKNSRSKDHYDWVTEESGFPPEGRFLASIAHSDGNNVLGMAQARKVVSYANTIQSLPDYDPVCSQSEYTDESGTPTCDIRSVSAFWNHSLEIFDSLVSSDKDAIEQMSAPYLPDGTPVFLPGMFGKAVRNETSGLLTFAQSYLIVVGLPDTDEAYDFEDTLLDAVLSVRDDWGDETLKLEVAATRSFSDEFLRAIFADLPLVPVVFLIMSIFTCFVFSECHKVRSRILLGLSAVLSVLLSIMTGYGFLFICGVPFTNMTQILPFVMFGVGLDDAFILYGAFRRTDQTKEPETRVLETVENVGISIILTTLTSSIAFGLGCTSTIPAVYWLCLFAFPTILLVFLYQLTFFVACLVLDEKRIIDNRRDCISCVRISTQEEDDESSMRPTSNSPPGKEAIADRGMEYLALQLLRPWVGYSVIIAFSALLVGCAFSASRLTQEFAFTDVLPDDSYLADYQSTVDSYRGRSPVTPYAYFRYVNQSDVTIQAQMKNYVNELVTIDAISEGPPFFWLRDFESFVDRTELEDLPFRTQLSLFLDVREYKELYEEDIILDSNGDIVTSRTLFYMDNVDLQDADSQVDALLDQRSVSERQPVNQGQEDWAFFTYESIYNIFEFYAVSVREVIYTTVLGVASVTGLALVFVPHWTAAPIILPVICVLYVDLLGVMQWAGIHINAVTYVSLILSIGLMVDFILHVLLRFYEAEGGRKQKVVHTLKTMGSSVLVGGISTFLGTLPLAFSTSEVFYTVFVAFIGLVTLGCGHGLILLPVLLSMFGPKDVISDSRNGSLTEKLALQRGNSLADVAKDKSEAVELANEDLAKAMSAIDDSQVVSENTESEIAGGLTLGDETRS